MREDRHQKVPEVQILQQKLIDAHKKIEHLEKQYKIKEVEALLKKQHDELVNLRAENTELKTQNTHMKRQIERLSTLVYSSVPKSQEIEPASKTPNRKDRKP